MLPRQLVSDALDQGKRGGGNSALVFWDLVRPAKEERSCDYNFSAQKDFSQKAPAGYLGPRMAILPPGLIVTSVWEGPPSASLYQVVTV